MIEEEMADIDFDDAAFLRLVPPDGKVLPRREGWCLSTSDLSAINWLHFQLRQWLPYCSEASTVSDMAQLLSELEAICLGEQLSGEIFDFSVRWVYPGRDDYSSGLMISRSGIDLTYTEWKKIGRQGYEHEFYCVATLTEDGGFDLDRVRDWFSKANFHMMDKNTVISLCIQR